MTFRNLVHFLETSPAAGRGGVLRDEDRMVSPGRLPSVVPRLCGREPFLDEFAALLHHPIDAPGFEIGAFSRAEAELSAERRCCKTVKCAFDVDHWHSFCCDAAHEPPPRKYRARS